MAQENQTDPQNIPQTDPQNIPQTDPQPAGGEPTPTDWRARAREWEDRSKANKKALDAANAELEKLRAFKDRATAAEQELAAIKAKAEHESLVARIAGEKGVPGNLIHGGNEEELAASADELKKYLDGLKPTNVPFFRDGGAPAPAGGDDLAEFARKFFNKEN